MSFSLYGFNSGFYGNNPHSQRGNGYFNNFLSNEQKKKETTSSQFNNIGKIAMTKTNYHFLKSPQNQNNQNFKANNNISPPLIQQESKNNITDAINRNFLNINYKPSPRNNENKNKTYNTGLYLSTNFSKVPTNNILDNKKDEEDMNKLTNEFDKLKITSANTGDSRAILITTDNKIIQLSNDHKPDEPNERKRIEQNGGRVSQAYGMGPFRVWLKNENYPGLAMSRSIGDKIAHSVGVSDIPEIIEFNFDDNKPKAIVVASDGVWEFLSNENVKDIILRFYDCGDTDLCARELCDNARRIWESSGYAIDDITAVVAFFGEK